MPDWSSSMQQTYEYYVVDPGTWKDIKRLDKVKNSSITRDAEAETLGSATLDTDDMLDECYVRTYLKTVQNGVTERHPLATNIVQTPSSTFDGKRKVNNLDAYTPLLELKENPPPIGYYIKKGENIMKAAYEITKEHLRAPVIEPHCDDTLSYDFVANVDDTWLTFLTDLIANASYTFGLDELGRVTFVPHQDVASLQPVWTYTDDNSSILQPKIDVNRDMYDLPNAVEVIYSNGNNNYYAKIVNNDPNSPISTVNRGREILYRDPNPDLIGTPTEKQIKEYAERLLRNLSSLEYTLTYTHGYCPVRLGDCVRLNYIKAGLTNVKAKVVNQTISCTPGCQVTEKAVYTVNLWKNCTTIVRGGLTS